MKNNPLFLQLYNFAKNNKKKKKDIDKMNTKEIKKLINANIDDIKTNKMKKLLLIILQKEEDEEMKNDINKKLSEKQVEWLNKNWQQLEPKNMEVL